MLLNFAVDMVNRKARKVFRKEREGLFRLKLFQWYNLLFT